MIPAPLGGTVRNYLIRRVLLLAPTVLVVCVVVFTLIDLVPGDVVLARLTQIGDATPETIDALRAELGIDRPFFIRLGEWFGRLFQADLGRSLWTLEPATKQLWSAIPVSLELVLGGMAIGVLAGIPLGVISAMRQNQPVDTGARILSVIGLAVPDFWIATMVILYASLVVGLLLSRRLHPVCRRPFAQLGTVLYPHGDPRRAAGGGDGPDDPLDAA